MSKYYNNNLAILICSIFAAVFGTIVSQRQFTRKNYDNIRYYKDRRWFLRNRNVKYILHWTSPKVEPFFGTGIEPFMQAKCPKRNCIVTKNKTYFKDILYFDALIFHGPDFWYNPSLLDSLPTIRSQLQKYVYYSTESADNYPLCDEELNNLFNLTWTYKLNSDLPYPYFIVRDKKGMVIGPKLEMQWKKFEEMRPIDISLKEKLKTKTSAVAWLVSICTTASNREQFADNLNDALANYGLKVDKYGKCSNSLYKCGRTDLMLPDCWELIQMEYYFYLSFENSFDEDYVTEKVLHPLQNFAVPIVYGAANYSRFLPEGSYLNARELGVNKLAKEINDIIKDEERYYSFFKWHNHYSFHSAYDSPDTNPFCALCAMLNKRKWHKTYPNFTSWWNLGGRCQIEDADLATPIDILFI